MSSVGCYGKSIPPLCHATLSTSTPIISQLIGSYFPSLNLILILPLIKIRKDTQAPSIQSPCSHYHNYKVPHQPFESAHPDAELKVRLQTIPLMEYLCWQNVTACWQIRSPQQTRNLAYRPYPFQNLSCCSELLKLDAKDPKRLFEGNALIRHLVRIGVLDKAHMRFDYALALKIEDFLERRLQTQAFKSSSAKSIHHACILIRQQHIRWVLTYGVLLSLLTFPIFRVGKQIVDIPLFVVRLDSQKHIDFALTSLYGGSRPGCVKRNRVAWVVV